MEMLARFGAFAAATVLCAAVLGFERWRTRRLPEGARAASWARSRRLVAAAFAAVLGVQLLVLYVGYQRERQELDRLFVEVGRSCLARCSASGQPRETCTIQCACMQSLLMQEPAQSRLRRLVQDRESPDGGGSRTVIRESQQACVDSNFDHYFESAVRNDLAQALAQCRQGAQPEECDAWARCAEEKMREPQYRANYRAYMRGDESAGEAHRHDVDTVADECAASGG